MSPAIALVLSLGVAIAVALPLQRVLRRYPTKIKPLLLAVGSILAFAAFVAVFVRR